MGFDEKKYRDFQKFVHTIVGIPLIIGVVIVAIALLLEKSWGMLLNIFSH